MGKKQASTYEFTQTETSGKKAAIYVRVSSQEFLLSRKDEKKIQEEARAKNISIAKADVAAIKKEIERQVRQSVATQKEDGIRFCKEKGWEYEIYDKDCDISGTLGSKDRPDLERLEKDIDSGKIHTVVVRDVKRIARNSSVLKNFIHDHLKPHGVNLIGRDDRIDISTPQGNFFTSILAEIAELEVASLKQSTMRNREQAALDGNLAHCSFTYGFESTGRRKIAVVPREADVVKKIFYDYAVLKLTTEQIARSLTAMGAPLKDGRAGVWEPSRLHQILRNPRYIGKINYREHKKLDSPFPPLIDMDVWEKAQQELKDRGRIGPRAHNSSHLLTSLLKCPYCLERRRTDPSIKPNMFSMVTRSQTSTVHYYDCQARHKHGAKACKGIRINAEKIESFIEAFVGALAADEFLKYVNEIPDSVKKASEAFNRIRIDLERQKRRCDELPTLLANPDISVNTAMKTAARAERELKRLRTELQEAEAELTSVSKAEQLDAIDRLKKWKSLTIRDKRKALKEVILEMVMHPDRLDITLRARPDSPIEIPYRRYRADRERPAFPDVTDGLTIKEVNGKLVIRIGAVFTDIHGREIHMDVDPWENASPFSYGTTPRIDQ